MNARHDTHETVRAFYRRFETIGSQNLYPSIACNGIPCRTARQGHFRTLIRHEVLVDLGHVRIRRRGRCCCGGLCHRLIRRTEVHRPKHEKQCKAFDCDCANFLKYRFLP